MCVCMCVSYPQTTTAVISRVCVCPILKPQQQPSQRYRVCVCDILKPQQQQSQRYRVCADIQSSNHNGSRLTCLCVSYPQTTATAVSPVSHVCVCACPILKPQQQASQRHRVCVCVSYSQTTTAAISAISCVCGCPILKPQRQPSRVFVRVLSSNHSNSRLSDIILQSDLKVLTHSVTIPWGILCPLAIQSMG